MVHTKDERPQFSGNIFIFHAFDVGDDINLERLKQSELIGTRSSISPKYFKNYHIPLTIQLPNKDESPACYSVKIHSFGSISLVYKIPFKNTLEQLRKNLEYIDDQFQEQSVTDGGTIFKIIKPYITKGRFFQLRSSYVLIQVNPESSLDIVSLKQHYGSTIAGTLRFETESLSEYQKNEILASAIGYYRGDLLVIDIDAAFMYDDEYTETLDFFEFANIQHLELRYFDRILDQQLTLIYEEKIRKVPLKSYLPFSGLFSKGPIDELSKLKADISVITERLEGSIKIAGEPYYSELYDLLVEKLDIKNWRDAIEKKLAILKDIQSVIQDKIDAAREDLLTTLIIILIFIELIIGTLHYLNL